MYTSPLHAGWLVLVVVECCRCSSPGARQLPQLVTTVASHKELGQRIGIRFKDDIKTAVAKNTFFIDKVLPYNKTEEGTATYRDLFGAAKESLPQYLDELEGMAEGAGIEFSMLFLWNVQFEMELLLQQTTPISSCSDIYMKGGSVQAAMGHNEDGSTSDMNTTYVVSARIMSTDAKMPLESFTALCYPGELCGNAFGFNRDKSLVYTVNAVFPENVNTKAVARNFLNRAIMCLSYSEIPEFLKRTPCSSGFSLNIGDLITLNMSNVEVSSEAVMQTKYENGTGYHFNMYMHSEVEQREDVSTDHRLQRVKELEPPKAIHDLRAILGDTEDRDYPIFRTASPPDSADTLATGIYDLQLKKLWIYRGNPASEQPQLTLSMERDSL